MSINQMCISLYMFINGLIEIVDGWIERLEIDCFRLDLD